MAEYIVALGRVDYFLCDEIPKEIHLKYQPKNDGNYENEPCQKCVEEYFLRKAGEQEWKHQKNTRMVSMTDIYMDWKLQK